MSSGCGDVLSLEDLKTAKKHQTFEAEVITGHAGGVSSGAEIDSATNQVTGQVQKTLPAILRDMGFERASFDFTTGGTLGIADRNKIVYNPPDNNWYSWAGALPKVVAPGENPLLDINWIPRTDEVLRADLAAGTVTIGNQNTVTVEKGLFYIIPDAIGDGVADDTLAVQNAINRCANGVLVIPPGKKYRCRNLTVPHPMAFWSAARRLDTWLEPYGNDGGTIHSGDFIKITTTGTVSFFNISLEARHVPLSYVDGQRLNGVNGGDNTSGQYQSGFAMYNCSVSGFSGINIRGGNNKSFGTISSNTQSESSGLSCIVINGVDWRIDHTYVGRSKERHGIEVYGQSNAITHCDSYFNYRDGIAYEVTSGNVLISIENCVVNSNGENGIRISGPYQQQGGCKVINNKIWNNSKNSDGVYHNIDINYGRGHQVHGNLHYEYSASADAGSSPRCAFCLNLRGGATLSGAWNDSVDPLYSYRSGAINVETQTVTNQNGYKIGSGIDFSKGITNDTRIGFSVTINGESFPRVEIAAGAVKLGNGASATSHGIQQLAAYPNVTMGIRGLGVIGDWQTSVFRIGTFRLWSDGSGNLRVKKGSDPTSATDGVILTSA